jgi:molybdenum cofactor guanylyltransferase
VAKTTTNGSKGDRHGKTTLASWGEFGRFELGIVGTTCEKVRQLAEALASAMPGLGVAYADAGHEAEAPGIQVPGFALSYDEHTTFRRLSEQGPAYPWLRKAAFNGADLVLVNGNHFTVSRQIVVIDPVKPLESRLQRIVHPVLILLSEGIDRIPGPVQAHLEHFGKLPVLRLMETAAIAAEIERLRRTMIPPLYGLVLAGGKSERMGFDKSRIEFHGRPQREHIYQLLQNHCDQTYLSCRPEQAPEFEGHFPFIADTFLGLSQFGAILSAFRLFPDAAWLVMASDLPLISHRSLDQLVRCRNSSRYATAFRNPENGYLEPLVTIWEPRSYPAMLHFLGLGYSCPRKVLMNTPVEILEPQWPAELSNVNSPEDLERVKLLLKKGARD